eukprot:TRINITY_DN796_c0_g2_i2.p1 TRINITY_DN796_c0_g2~~TRINITY_DN796_c0_g2_i2.p1  ORF type:complete len:612 (+),score=191.01 TRINITY_DN796_c0_g2_i2:255-2090(+)
MPSFSELDEEFAKSGYADGKVMPDDRVVQLIDETDEPMRESLFGGSFDQTAFESFLSVIVDQLNSADCHEHKKTRLLIVLNNCAAHRAARQTIFTAVKTLDLAMERSMKVEGTMPFDSELGRMSEHMLVLLCRVQGFKIRANQVLEFAEGNVQFAVQLLLAILLKEPPYEFELRVNCMTGLLGFSHPGAFFTPDSARSIEEKALSDFEDKVNQICKLSKRLLVMQVVAEAINPHLIREGPVQPVVHVACQSIMKFVTNVFNYATQQATAFRQHIITATTFVDQVVVPYICKLIQQVACAYDMHTEKVATSGAFNPLKPPPRAESIPQEVVQGLTCSLRFLALCTFHMGSYGRALRFVNSFTHDLFRLPLHAFICQRPALYGALLQYNCNIDALAGEDGFSHAEHLPQDCLSDSISGMILTVLSGMERDDIIVLQRSFNRTQDTLLARDVVSYQKIDKLLSESLDACGKKFDDVQQSEAAQYRLLGDLPDPHDRKVEKEAADEAVKTDDRLVRPSGAAEAVQAEGNAPARFRCSLNGHLMKDPVRSPHGHVFERETIMKWLESAGSTCPFTAKPLSRSDLEDDLDLRAAIASWHIKESMQANDEDEFDVYDF